MHLAITATVVGENANSFVFEVTLLVSTRQ